MEIRIIRNKVGIACGSFDGKRTKISIPNLDKSKSIAQTISEWIFDDEKVLIAIDAPLGWPEKLGKTLIDHYAGKSLNIDDPNELFRRTTDKCVKQKIGKQPLDVGADRIARTAHIALKIIEELRKQKKLKEIPLAWKNELESRISLIEVYPGATLKAHGITSTNYKEKEQTELRKKIIKQILNSKSLEITCDLKNIEENDDLLDSVICVWAAHDFLIDDVIKPEDIKIDLEIARKEGWIWVKNKSKIQKLEDKKTIIETKHTII